MASDVKSKNPYDLLGNTIDSDDEGKAPVIPVDKSVDRSGKRNAPKAAPVAAAGRGGGASRARGGFTGSEAAFRDRATGRNFNKDKATDELETGVRPGRDGGPGARRGRGGRGGPRRGGDRRDRSGQQEHQKQADQAWGEPTGDGEWADEKAGQAIATAEVKEGGFDATTEAPVDAEGNSYEEKQPEPEDTSKSYSDYLAEQAAKREAAGLGLREARQANEGSKVNKKWETAKALTKESDDDYYAGQEKARRERERGAKKEFLDLDYSFKEQPRDSRGGGRGGGGRGGGRGRGGSGESRGRGDFAIRSRGRGGRGRGGADGPGVAVNDESAFPSLGA